MRCTDRVVQLIFKRLYKGDDTDGHGDGNKYGYVYTYDGEKKYAVMDAKETVYPVLDKARPQDLIKLTLRDNGGKYLIVKKAEIIGRSKPVQQVQQVQFDIFSV